MRIAVDARPLSLPITGIGRYTYSLLTELTTVGHEWCLYSDSPLETGLSGLGNVTLRCGNANPSSLRGLYYSQWQYRNWIKRDKPDLFWSPRHHLPINLDRPLLQVLTIHDVVWKRFPETMTWQARSLERLLMPRSIRQARRIICVSHFTASEIENFWPEQAGKCTVIPSGVSADEEHGLQEADIEKPYVLFVGTLEPRKNLQLLLEAFAGLVRDGAIQESLVIVGAEGWGELNLAKVVKSLGVEERVSILGYVSDDHLSSLYMGARCLVMPSLYEGFGLPVLEAISFGVPVIVSDAGSLPEVAGDAGLIVDPNSRHSMAQAMSRLLNDDVFHAQLVKRARTRSGEYSWRKAANETLRLFETLVA
jgi:glycosyltransferase involved in cell wall biosynthesis